MLVHCLLAVFCMRTTLHCFLVVVMDSRNLLICYDYGVQWDIKFNPQKSQAATFGGNSPPVSVKLGDAAFKPGTHWRHVDPACILYLATCILYPAAKSCIWRHVERFGYMLPKVEHVQLLATCSMLQTDTATCIRSVYAL